MCFLSASAGLTPEGVHQAFHAQLMLHSHIARNAAVPLSSILQDQLPTLPEPLQSHARHMWLTSAIDVHVSKLQSDVSNALQLAGIPNTMEWLTDDGLFSIDIAFQVDGQPVAVEVDGSHHYTNSAPQMPLSEVLVRRRLLQVIEAVRQWPWLGTHSLKGLLGSLLPREGVEEGLLCTVLCVVLLNGCCSL